MKRIIFLTALASLAVLGVQAQDAPPPKVKLKPLKVGQVETPQFTANNVGEKRWKPKAWLEADVEFEVDIPRDRKGSLDTLVVNVFIVFNHKSKAGKTEYCKGTFNCTDIPSNEKSHMLAYVSPAMLHRVLEKDNFTSSSDVSGWGVEIVIDGKRAAVESSLGKTLWWENAEAMELVDGTLLSKKETPFAVLWGDYDLNVKK